jgi:plastocyanin
VGPVEAADPRRVLVTVSGVVSGGGEQGPGGAVVLLRRADGPTPRPKAARVRSIVQKDKRYLPHVLAIPLGATVEFRNDDDIFHNVFSLSKPNDFDLGLYKSGVAREQIFASPGPVQLLCNIHSSMQAWVYVSDTPWFGQADAQGRFSVRGVPPGAYTLEVWHEWSTKGARRAVTVAAGMAEVAVQVDGDRRAPVFVPDKSGKPRQPQLGY